MVKSLATSLPGRRWWKDATVYQVYPASFKDSNGDGFGDLRGIINSLDYLQSIGIDCVWVSPFFESPQYDLGYDVSDYEAVYKPYGTVADTEELIEACHQRGLRVLFDLVVNHTSHLHAWFIESRSSKDSPKRQWYHWHPGRLVDGERKPPNNWRANFGGSAWNWDEHTQEFYLSLFCPEQPDLNWESEDCRNAIYRSAMEFWLNKGIDGFRVDTMTIYAKHPEYPDAPITDPSSPYQLGSSLYRNQPRQFDHLREMNDKVLSKYGDIMTVGEYGNTSDTDIALRYSSEKERRAGMGFQFENVCIGYEMAQFELQPFTLCDFKKPWAKWQQFIDGTDGWTSAFLENHDVPRSLGRFGSDEPQYHDATAKMLAMCLATSTGTLFIYQGQEIGMTNIPKSWPIEEYKDLNTQNHWKELLASNPSADTLQSAMDCVQKVARDHGRTPFQWDDSPHGGFTTGKPWMRVNDNFTTINVKRQATDDASILSFWKESLALRKKHIDLFAHGSFKYVDEGNQSVMAYIKRFHDQACFVILNFTSSPQPRTIPEEFSGATVAMSNSSAPTTTLLGPYEGAIYIK